MPDYDPKSIPILDDIIEDDKTDTEQIHPDITVNGSEQDDNIPDLFTTAADIDTTDINIEAAATGIAAIDQFIGSAEENTMDLDTETGESALIDYHAEEFDDPAVELRQDEAYQEHSPLQEVQQYDDLNTAESAVDTITANNMADESVQPVSLKPIVDDVVKQLMPDLEQQLRFLVQQALEEKLPADIIEQISTDNNDD